MVVGPKSISNSSEDDLAGALVVLVGADVRNNGCVTVILLLLVVVVVGALVPLDVDRGAGTPPPLCCTTLGRLAVAIGID